MLLAGTQFALDSLDPGAECGKGALLLVVIRGKSGVVAVEGVGPEWQPIRRPN